MGGVLPGEANAAVHLDRLHGRGVIGLRTSESGQGDRAVRADRIGVELRCGVLRGGRGRFDFQQQISGHVLDRLEAADGPPELDSGLEVFDGDVEQSAGATDLFAGQGNDRE